MGPVAVESLELAVNCWLVFRLLQRRAEEMQSSSHSEFCIPSRS